MRSKMAVEVHSICITGKDYNELKNNYHRPYLHLLPDYPIEKLEFIELFLTDTELIDINFFLSPLD